MDLETELQAALDDFHRLTDELSAKFTDDVRKAAVPEKIYHYTNDTSLRGILESKIVRMTNIFNLNDPSEIKHGYFCAVDILSTLAKSGTLKQRDFASRFAALYPSKVEQVADIFVTSFSKQKDELGQWRAYADDGTGYLLEFDTSTLEGIFLKKHGTANGLYGTFDINYRTSQIQAIMRLLATKALTLVDLPYKIKASLSQTQAYLTNLSIRLAQSVLETSVYFKHEGYEAEDEYRFLQMWDVLNPPPTGSVFRKDEVVRFRELTWMTPEVNALTGVFIGPAADRDKCQRYVEECFRVTNVAPVPIGFSKIPYRSMRKN